VPTAILNRRRVARRALTVLASAGLIWMAIGVPTATASHSQTAGTVSAAFTNPTITAAGTVALTLRVTNSGTSHKAIRSIRVSAPAGYQMSSTLFVFDTSHTVAPGGSVDLALTAGVPDGCGVATSAWKVWADTDVNAGEDDPGGDLDDDFQPYPSSATTTVFNACALAFQTQPATAIKGQNITSQALAPGGTPVTVQVVDTANGNALVTALDGSTVTFTVADGTPAQSLTTTAGVISGSASFAGSLPQSGDGYRIHAALTSSVVTGVSVAPATSGTFSIIDAGATCASGQSCSADATSTNGSNSSFGVTAGAGTSSDLLTLAFTPADTQCTLPIIGTSYPNTTGTVTINVTGTRTKIVDITIPKATAQAAGRPFAIQYHVCFNSPTPFIPLLGTARHKVTTGLLPSCWRYASDDEPPSTVTDPNFAGPCVIWKYRASNGDIKARFFAPAGDPRGYM
jgi:hypothetical protein